VKKEKNEKKKKRKEKEKEIEKLENTTGSPSWRDHKHEYCV
jgi:hypothetical protein